MPTYVGQPYRDGERAKCITSKNEILMVLRQRGLVGMLAWYMSAGGWDLELKQDLKQDKENER